FAKQLIHDSRLPMAELAKAAGFGNVRRFNEAFRQLFRCRRARCAARRWWRFRRARWRGRG
ncbi:MAG TPA: hypothetical protein VHN14_10610, partial [Kofleriaceae bacterium]|nr:hypothetical protein [Kofleriaceae bacterium]